MKIKTNIAVLVLLALVPAKGDVEVANIRLVPGNYQITWNASIGDRYVLECKATELGPDWQGIYGPSMATTNHLTVLVPMSGLTNIPMAWFRVKNLTGGSITGIALAEYEGITGWKARLTFKPPYPDGTWLVRGSNNLGDFLFEAQGSLTATNWLGQIVAEDTNALPTAHGYPGTNVAYYIEAQRPGYRTLSRLVLSELDRRPEDGDPTGLALGLVGSQFETTTLTNSPYSNLEEVLKQAVFRFQNFGSVYNLATLAPVDSTESWNTLNSDTAWQSLGQFLKGQLVLPPTYLYLYCQGGSNYLGGPAEAQKITAEEFSASGFSNKLTFAFISGHNVSSNMLAALVDPKVRTLDEVTVRGLYPRFGCGYRDYDWSSIQNGDIPEEIKLFETRFFEALWRGSQNGTTVMDALAFASVLPNGQRNHAADHFYWVGCSELRARDIVPDEFWVRPFLRL